MTFHEVGKVEELSPHGSSVMPLVNYEIKYDFSVDKV